MASRSATTDKDETGAEAEREERPTPPSTGGAIQPPRSTKVEVDLEKLVDALIPLAEAAVHVLDAMTYRIMNPVTPGSRPSNQQRSPVMSIQEEDEKRARLIAKMEDCPDREAFDAIMMHEGTKAFLAQASSRTRKAIEDVDREMRRRLEYARSDRQGSRRDGDGRAPDRDERDDRGRDYDRRPSRDLDDDIPF